VRFELVVGIVVIPFNRRLLERSVHPPGLAVRPGVSNFRQPVLRPVFPANPVENVFNAVESGLRLVN
jgi:hypothetical protein